MKHYIYCQEPMWNRMGGVVGYLSHLYSGMSSIGRFEGRTGVQHRFVFPTSVLPNRHCAELDPSAIHPSPFNYKLDARTPYIARKLKMFSEVPAMESMLKFSVHQMASVHIHGHYNFIPIYNFLRVCGLEEQVVKVLTTHNPIKPSLEDEVYDGGRTKASELEDFRFFHNYRDEFAFTKADALLFPCEEAMEPYFQTWPRFAEIIKDKPVYFSTTGALKSDVVTPRNVLRRELNIPEDAKVFLYIGRFMKVRGIDTFVDAARRMIERNSGCYFVAVGEDIPAPLIESPYWIQRGFTQYPADYMTMADCCVIASNHNYFDLGMIEILAQGSPLIAAETGGCRYLKSRTTGVLYFEPGSGESLVEAMLRYSQVESAENKQMKDDNRALYQRELTAEHFAEGYLETIDKLYRDFQIVEPQRQIVKMPFLQVTADDLPFPQAKREPAEDKKVKATSPSATASSTPPSVPERSLPLGQRVLKPVVRPFVRQLGTRNDLKKFDADPSAFFAGLSSPRYRAVGKLLFPV